MFARWLRKACTKLPWSAFSTVAGRLKWFPQSLAPRRQNGNARQLRDLRLPHLRTRIPLRLFDAREFSALANFKTNQLRKL
jgi:hypothetical protein